MWRSQHQNKMILNIFKESRKSVATVLIPEVVALSHVVMQSTKEKVRSDPSPGGMQAR